MGGRCRKIMKVTQYLKFGKTTPKAKWSKTGRLSLQPNILPQQRADKPRALMLGRVRVNLGFPPRYVTLGKSLHLSGPVSSAMSSPHRVTGGVKCWAESLLTAVLNKYQQLPGLGLVSGVWHKPAHKPWPPTGSIPTWVGVRISCVPEAFRETSLSLWTSSTGEWDLAIGEQKVVPTQTFLWKSGPLISFHAGIPTRHYISQHKARGLQSEAVNPVYQCRISWR